MISYILISGYSVLLFMNPLNFIGLFRCCYFESASCQSACRSELFQRFFNKNVWKIKKNVKKREKRDQNKKKRFYIYGGHQAVLRLS